MKKRAFTVVFLIIYFLAGLGRVAAQSAAPYIVVLKADAAVFPAMEEYIRRGVAAAEQRNAEAVILELNTPGGSIETMNNIVQIIRGSTVPVIVYVSPRGAMAASAGSLITLAGHAAAMAPETTIGAASPVGEGGSELDPTIKSKLIEETKATVRALAERRGETAVTLGEDMIENAKAVSAKEALQAGLVDFIASDVNDLLNKLDGFKVQVKDKASANDVERVLHTKGATTEDINFSFIEQLLDILVSPAIIVLLTTIGVQAILIEISSPGGWAAGFIGLVCLALAAYGYGVLPVNWFGIAFILISFVLFILDIKAPTHGALTAAGIGSLMVGALVLFNTSVTPVYLHIPVPTVIAIGLITGLPFAIIVGFAVRSQRLPRQMGEERLAGKTGIAKTDIAPSGQVQVQSELWSAELAAGAEPIRAGEGVEVVEISGLRLKVRKL